MADNSVHIMIHGATKAAAGVGAGFAQIPGSDAPVLMTIQTGMILGIAQHHGVSLTKTAAADMVLTFAASMTGRVISQFLVGWFPVIGNAINASTAAAITEAIGWSAETYFTEAKVKAGHP